MAMRWEENEEKPANTEPFTWDKNAVEKKADRIINGKRIPLKLYLVAGVIGAGAYLAMMGGEYLMANPKIVDTVTQTFQEIVSPNPPDSFAQIIDIKSYYLLAKRNDGRYELRTGGRAAWRYNSSCKLIHGEFTRKMGALGSDGKLAVFPSYSLGKRACHVMLFESDDHDYKNSTIKEAMAAFVPKSKFHNTEKYTAAVVKAVGATLDTKMSDLTDKQRQSFLNEIETQERFIYGTTNLFADEEEWERYGW